MREAAQAMEWTEEEGILLDRLTSPGAIQDFLDELTYSPDKFYRSPRRVLKDRLAHCFDGALLAAAALDRIGFPPLVVDLRAVRDDDHIITVYKRDGHFGALAKSNFVGLRFREPIYRSLRELAISYFESYYNLEGEKSLREYSVPLNLGAFDALRWRYDEGGLERIAEALDSIRHYPLLSPEMVSALRRMDQRSFEAGMVGVNEAGLYQGE